MGSFLLGIQQRVQTSRGKRAISVRPTQVLLYIMTDGLLNGPPEPTTVTLM